MVIASKAFRAKEFLQEHLIQLSFYCKRNHMSWRLMVQTVELLHAPKKPALALGALSTKT
jgi:hypothetical protein